MPMHDMAALHVFVLLFIIISSSCQSESDDQLTQAKVLSPGDTLVSRNGVFALGFFSPTNSNQSWYLGIWYQYNNAHDVTVWVANRDNPVTSSAKLAITDNQELALSDSGTTVWSTPSSSTGAATGAAAAVVAVLLNSGNFVLWSANGTTVWQSFDHPSATILPTMQVLLSYKGSVATRIVACKSAVDMSPGDFSGSIDPSSNLQFFVWKSGRPYYRISFFDDVSVFGFGGDGGGSSDISAVVHPSVINTGDEVYYTYKVSDGSLLTRVLLKHDGSMSLLTRTNTSSEWRPTFERPNPNSVCDLYASCGPFGYCDHTEAVPSCRCLDGFELIDGLDISRGCRRKEALECGVEDRFVTLPGMTVPDKFLQIGSRTMEQCAAECSANCSCTAYAYVNLSSAGAYTWRCLLWTGDLVDTGKAAASSGQNLYLRLAGSQVERKSNLLKILLPVIACVLLLTLGALVWTCKSKGKRQKKRVQKRRMQEYLSSTDDAGDKNIDFTFISFESIVTATDNFSERNMLGRGGFGKVYKGMLEGTKEVAVKRLSMGSGQGKEEFKNEVDLIAKLQHKNLVRLLGCCIHEDEKLLVYEYLPNKSLDYFLFASARKSMLQWPTRFKIIQGVARGIMYLHHDSRLTVIHRDIKASNILLDKEMNPKISDFGMARIFCGDQLQENTKRVAGTYGYMSPEYAMEGAFSVKSDTYSFGVLLLEIVSGIKISSPNLPMDFPNLIVQAWNLWNDGKIEALVDSSIKENCPLDEISRCVHIGLLCVQDSPNCRPLMSAVVFMLENKTTPLPIPTQPVYFARRDDEPGRADKSLNNMSLTELEGR